MSAISLANQDAGFISSRILAHLPFISGVNVDLIGKNNQARSSVESYIHSKFNERYAANVQTFLPHILTLSCNDRFCAAVGVRAAESEPLYLEKYLRYPIEQEIGMRFKTEIKRENIIEIGNLVSTWRGSSQLLFVFLTDLLARVDREWVVFTATREVEHLLSRMNFTLIHLVDASKSMLGDEKEQWGSYYEENPKVMFGHVPSAMSILKQHTLMSSSLSLFSEQLEELAVQWNYGS